METTEELAKLQPEILFLSVYYIGDNGEDYSVTDRIKKIEEMEAWFKRHVSHHYLDGKLNGWRMNVKPTKATITFYDKNAIEFITKKVCLKCFGNDGNADDCYLCYPFDPKSEIDPTI